MKVDISRATQAGHDDRPYLPDRTRTPKIFVSFAPKPQAKPLDFFATYPVFTRSDFGAVRDQASTRTGTNLLAYHVGTGRLLHVRRGLYAVVPHGVDAATFTPDPYFVATKLAPDATVALHAALQFRGRTSSVWNQFHVATRAKVTPFTFRGSSCLPVRPPSGAGASAPGVVEERHAGGTVRVTSYERTLVDLVDAPDVGGGFEEVWRSLEMVEFFNLDAVVAAALSRDAAITAVRVGFFLEQHREPLMVELEPRRAGGRPSPPLGGSALTLPLTDLQRLAATAGFRAIIATHPALAWKAVKSGGNEVLEEISPPMEGMTSSMEGIAPPIEGLRHRRGARGRPRPRAPCPARAALRGSVGCAAARRRPRARRHSSGNARTPPDTDHPRRRRQPPGSLWSHPRIDRRALGGPGQPDPTPMTPLHIRLLALNRTLRIPLTTLEKGVPLGALLAAVAADPTLGETPVSRLLCPDSTVSR